LKRALLAVVVLPLCACNAVDGADQYKKGDAPATCEQSCIDTSGTCLAKCTSTRDTCKSASSCNPGCQNKCDSDYSSCTNACVSTCTDCACSQSACENATIPEAGASD